MKEEQNKVLIVGDQQQLRVRQLHRWYKRAKTEQEREKWKLQMKMLGIEFDKELLKQKL